MTSSATPLDLGGFSIGTGGGHLACFRVVVDLVPDEIDVGRREPHGVLGPHVRDLRAVFGTFGSTGRRGREIDREHLRCEAHRHGLLGRFAVGDERVTTQHDGAGVAGVDGISMPCDRGDAATARSVTWSRRRLRAWRTLVL